MIGANTDRLRLHARTLRVIAHHVESTGRGVKVTVGRLDGSKPLSSSIDLATRAAVLRMNGAASDLRGSADRVDRYALAVEVMEAMVAPVKTPVLHFLMALETVDRLTQLRPGSWPYVVSDALTVTDVATGALGKYPERWDQIRRLYMRGAAFVRPGADLLPHLRLMAIRSANSTLRTGSGLLASVVRALPSDRSRLRAIQEMLARPRWARVGDALKSMARGATVAVRTAGGLLGGRVVSFVRSTAGRLGAVGADLFNIAARGARLGRVGEFMARASEGARRLAPAVSRFARFIDVVLMPFHVRTLFDARSLGRERLDAAVGVVAGGVVVVAAAASLIVGAPVLGTAVAVVAIGATIWQLAVPDVAKDFVADRISDVAGSGLESLRQGGVALADGASSAAASVAGDVGRGLAQAQDFLASKFAWGLPSRA